MARMNTSSKASASVTTGYSLGSIFAGGLSWMLNKSVGWALFHFFTGWLYVFYAACARTDEVERVIHSLGG